MNSQNNKNKLVRGSRIHHQGLSDYFIMSDNEVDDDDDIDNFVENKKNEYRIKRDNIVKSCKQNTKKYNYSDCYNDPKCKENCINYDINIMDINNFLGESKDDSEDDDTNEYDQALNDLGNYSDYSDYYDKNKYDKMNAEAKKYLDDYNKDFDNMSTEFVKYSDKLDDEYYKTLKLLEQINSNMSALNFRGSNANMYANDYKPKYTNLAKVSKRINRGDNVECKKVRDLTNNAVYQKFLTDMDSNCNIYIYNKYLIKDLRIILCNLNNDSKNNLLDGTSINKYLLIVYYLLNGTFYNDGCKTQRTVIMMIDSYIKSDHLVSNLKGYIKTACSKYFELNNKSATHACEELLTDLLTIQALLHKIYNQHNIKKFIENIANDTFKYKFVENGNLDKYDMIKGRFTMYNNTIVGVLNYFSNYKFTNNASKLMKDGILRYNLD